MNVVPYDENWANLFQQEKVLLQGILGEEVISIEHFGSTSVEGLSAKPIIDILVLVKNIGEVDGYNDQMSAAGYDVRGEHGMPGRRYFVRFKNDNSGNHTHHIHVYQLDNQAAKDELLFRDYLRINESAKKEYNDLKIELSKKHYTEPLAYTDGKTECVLGILQRAREHFCDIENQMVQGGIFEMKIKALDGIYKETVINHVFEEWGEPIVSRGNIVNIRDIPGFIALKNGALIGAILYEIRDKECEIVALYSLVESIGVGTSLINSVVDVAKTENCGRVWLITMNDSTRAIRFYQRRGFDLKAVHINAFDVTRKLKKEPLGEIVLGIDDIPIKHEFEFEIKL